MSELSSDVSVDISDEPASLMPYLWYPSRDSNEQQLGSAVFLVVDSEGNLLISSSLESETPWL